MFTKARVLLLAAAVAAFVAGPVCQAGRARISQAYTSMTLAGDGWWEIVSPVYIDDVLHADGWDANLELGVNKFLFIDSATYNIKTDYLTADHMAQAALFTAAVAPIDLGSDEYTTLTRLSLTANPGDVLICADTGQSPFIDFSGFDGSEPWGADHTVINCLNFRPGQGITLEGLNIVENTGNYPVGLPHFLKTQFGAGSFLPVFKDCTYESGGFPFFGAFNTPIATESIPYAAGPAKEFDNCGFRIGLNSSQPFADNRSNWITYFSGMAGGAGGPFKILGGWEWDHCTFIGPVDLSIPDKTFSLLRGDCFQKPDWFITRSIFFNLRGYQGNIASPPNSLLNIIEWDDLATPVFATTPGGVPAAVFNRQLIDPEFVDIANSFATLPGGLAETAGIGFGNLIVPPNSVRGWMLYD